MWVMDLFVLSSVSVMWIVGICSISNVVLMVKVSSSVCIMFVCNVCVLFVLCVCDISFVVFMCRKLKF